MNKTKKEKLLNLIKSAAQAGLLNDVLKTIDVTIDEKATVVDFRNLVNQISDLSKSQKGVADKIDVLIKDGLQINNLEDMKTDTDDLENAIKEQTEVSKFLRLDLKGVRMATRQAAKEQGEIFIQESKKQSEGIAQAIGALFLGISQLFTGLFKSTTFKIMPVKEAFTTPQYVVFYDPVTNSVVRPQELMSRVALTMAQATSNSTGGGTTPATSATVANVDMTDANTEYSYTFPTGTKSFTMKLRSQSVKFKYAYTEGESGTTYQEMGQNFTLREENLNFTSKTIYFQAPSASQVMEIVSYQ